MKFKLEVIGFTIESCLIAQAAGAHRIELCDNPSEGGTTPSYGFIKTARENLSIELYPIIRPRGGDFLYSEIEFELMKADIQICKNLGCDGVVIGWVGCTTAKGVWPFVSVGHGMAAVGTAAKTCGHAMRRPCAVNPQRGRRQSRAGERDIHTLVGVAREIGYHHRGTWRQRLGDPQGV